MEWFGLSIAALDGHVYGVGDCELPFTIQSVSKPFVCALALEDRGADAVHNRVGVEPTGDSFNSISIDAATGRPFNPMVNAGASLSPPAWLPERTERISSSAFGKVYRYSRGATKCL